MRTQSIRDIELTYSIWRMVSLYVAAFRRNPQQLIPRLVVVLLADVFVAFFTPKINAENSILAFGLSLLWTVVAWIPLIAYLSLFAFDLLNSLGLSVRRPKERLLPLFGIVGVACVGNFFIMTASQILHLSSVRASWGLLLIAISYAFYAWLSISIVIVIEGTGFLRACWRSLVFFSHNLGRIITFLAIAVLLYFIFFVILAIAARDLMGQGIVSPQLLNALKSFATALIIPITIFIYVKLTHFQDPPKLKPLVGL